MKPLIMGMLLFVMAFSSLAGVTYTKENLNVIYEKGKLPKVGQAVTKEDTPMDFNECRNIGNQTYAASVGSYPAKIINDSGVEYQLKIWKENGLVVFNCSRTEGRKTITQADYQ
ncbi:hypothetical protein ABK905_18955 [Acerihabitans sp. KWT182]|uniref:Uncharacterized protein n=1 Tax=Acerihabitans sp. KWT182 TaxID=3157919 RepID=A0AAU7Q6M9_9GAMM